MNLEFLIKTYIADTTTMNIPQMIFVVQEYIYEKKGVKIIINHPNHQIQVSMLVTLFNIAFDYFCIKLKSTV